MCASRFTPRTVHVRGACVYTYGIPFVLNVQKGAPSRAQSAFCPFCQLHARPLMKARTKKGASYIWSESTVVFRAMSSLDVQLSEIYSLHINSLVLVKSDRKNVFVQ